MPKPRKKQKSITKIKRLIEIDKNRTKLIEKRNKLLSYIKNNCQVIITTTDLKNIEEKILKKSKKINIKNGKIKRKGDKNGKESTL